MGYLFSVCLLIGTVYGQQQGTKTQEWHPKMTIEHCTNGGNCEAEQGQATIDSNWRWLHQTGQYKNCYTGNTWDKSLCPDVDSCTKNCALEGVDETTWSGTYGVTAYQGGLRLNFVTQGPYSKNIGSRTYYMDTDSTYKMFKLVNKEFTFTTDVSTLDCGLNGALYFAEMQQDGGKSAFPTNMCGAKYGTGYCDAQCPHDMKWINGYHRCEGTECGDNGKDRYHGVCDKDGCDLNPYRAGNKTFFGPGESFVIDSSKPVTVVTQFISSDGTDDGDLVEIKRFHVQDNKVIPQPFTNIPNLRGDQLNSLTDANCKAQKEAMGDYNDFAIKGGMKKMGEALKRGMVLVMSLWDDHYAYMLWLDSAYPLDKPVTQPGILRGPCPTSSGRPKDVESKQANSYVSYYDIKYGDINSTFAHWQL